MTDRSSRSYRKVARAEREAETRERITSAAVELHEALGPANTRITDVAKRAGVSRMTVYNHFPTEVDLFMACSTHWARANPFPDPGAWSRVEDVDQRLSTALSELYAWYDLKRGMLGKVFRDTPVLPSLGEVMGELWDPYVEQIVEVLATGWQVEAARSDSLRAALRLVVDFQTWRSLADGGLSGAAASELASRMVLSALPPG